MNEVFNFVMEHPWWALYVAVLGHIVLSAVRARKD